MTALNLAAQPQSPEQAALYEEALHMLAALHNRIEPFTELLPLGYGFSGLSRSGVVRIAIPFDAITPSSAPDDEFLQIVRQAREVYGGAIEVWVTGDVDDSYIREADELGVKVFQNVRFGNFAEIAGTE